MTPPPQRRYRTLLSLAAATTAAVALAGSPWTSAQGLASASTRVAKGDFLVASRDLGDPNFSRTVVLMLEHGPGGSLGLIVNRPTAMKLGDLLPDMEGLEERQDTVYVGGPVLPGAVLLLVRSASAPPDSEQVLEEIHYSGSRELLAKLVGGDGGEPFRVYAGHAGWAPGQLEFEMRRGSWHAVPADGAAVFDEKPLELWDKMIRRSATLLARLLTIDKEEPGDQIFVPFPHRADATVDPSRLHARIARGPRHRRGRARRRRRRSAGRRDHMAAAHEGRRHHVSVAGPQPESAAAVSAAARSGRM